MAMTCGKLNLNIRDFDKYNNPIWRARGWAWVDPLKDSHANEIAIAQKTRTRNQIAADHGNDIEEIFQQIVFEEELARKYGLKLDDQKNEKPEVTSNDESDD
jgi:capsid protein